MSDSLDNRMKVSLVVQRDAPLVEKSKDRTTHGQTLLYVSVECFGYLFDLLRIFFALCKDCRVRLMNFLSEVRDYLVDWVLN